MSSIPALRVRQWLAAWDQVPFDAKEFRRRPEPYFYVFSISAAHLKRLSGIQRRTRQVGAQPDLGIQRRHDEDRSREIQRYVAGGLPWSELRTFDVTQFADVRMPGWLPTAIVVNIMAPSDERWGALVHSNELVTVVNGPGEVVTMNLPDGSEKPGWNLVRHHVELHG